MATSDDAVSRVLAPAGLAAAFFAFTTPPDARESMHGSTTLAADKALPIDTKMNFELAGGALEAFSLELVRQGALAVALDPFSPLASQRRDLPSTLQPRVMILDRRRRIGRRATSLFIPIAEELGLPVDDLEVIGDPIVAAPLRRSLDIRDDQRRDWSDLILALDTTYRLLVGIARGVQVDVPLEAYTDVLTRFYSRVRRGAAKTTIAMLLALSTSYEPRPVAALEPLPPYRSGAWVEAFSDFLDDESFRQYARERYKLGVPGLVGGALERSAVLARRLARKKPFRSLLRVAFRLVRTSTGVPVEGEDVERLFGGTPYLPPLVRTDQSVRDAVAALVTPANGYHGVIRFTAPEFDWLHMYEWRGRLTAEMKLPPEFFKAYKTLDGPIDIRRKMHRESFEQYAAVNLTQPHVCPEHRIAIDDATFVWGKEGAAISLQACCERAASEGFLRMLAFDPTLSARDRSTQVL